MNILIAIVGVVSGYLLARLKSSQLLLLTYHFPYRFWLSYEQLFDTFENKFSYAMIGEKRFKNYRDFLVHYNKAKRHVNDHFRARWNIHFRYIARDYGLTLTASLILFWSNYLMFIGPFIAVHVVYLLWLRFGKKKSPYIFKIYMFEMLFTDT